MEARHRRVVVGLDDRGRSTVVRDGRDMALAQPPTGVTIQEAWWQRQVPARLNDDGVRAGSIGLAAPPGGAVVRVLTVPPTPVDRSVDLHYDDSMHVITLISGQLDVILEVEEVALAPGDTIVLPASVHDLRNRHDVDATFVYTSFPLSR